MDANEQNIVLGIPDDERGTVIYEQFSDWRSDATAPSSSRLQLLPCTSERNRGLPVCAECQEESDAEQGYSVCAFEGVRTIRVDSTAETTFDFKPVPDIPFFFKPNEPIEPQRLIQIKVKFMTAGSTLNSYWFPGCNSSGAHAISCKAN